MDNANSILLSVGKQQERLRELYLEAYNDPNMNYYGNKELTCALHAITQLTKTGTVDELIEAAGIVATYMSMKKLETLGLCKLNYRKTDIYGFPTVYR